MKPLQNIILGLIIIHFNSCGFYSLNGADVGNAKTFQVDQFPNNAPIVDPSLSNEFRITLQDLFNNQTSLDLVNFNGDLRFEGEITDYRVSPMTATADQTAAQNRLTITIKVRFYNITKEENNFEKSFSFFYDYGANEQLTSISSIAHQEILERISQDIFNESVAKW